MCIVLTTFSWGRWDPVRKQLRASAPSFSQILSFHLFSVVVCDQEVKTQQNRCTLKQRFMRHTFKSNVTAMNHTWSTFQAHKGRFWLMRPNQWEIVGVYITISKALSFYPSRPERVSKSLRFWCLIKVDSHICTIQELSDWLIWIDWSLMQIIRVGLGHWYRFPVSTEL